MSRVGLSPVQIPKDVETHMSGDTFVVKGKLGELSVSVAKSVGIEVADGVATVSITNRNKATRQIWGTVRALLQQAITGVTVGYKKQIKMNGVGYRASVKGSSLQLQLGFSHDVQYPIPSNVKISVDANIITIEGIDAQTVGQVASEIRAYRPPEPYKGKGLFYVDEKILRKEGKKK